MSSLLVLRILVVSTALLATMPGNSLAQRRRGGWRRFGSKKGTDDEVAPTPADVTSAFTTEEVLIPAVTTRKPPSSKDDDADVTASYEESRDVEEDDDLTPQALLKAQPRRKNLLQRLRERFRLRKRGRGKTDKTSCKRLKESYQYAGCYGKINIKCRRIEAQLAKAKECGFFPCEGYEHPVEQTCKVSSCRGGIEVTGGLCASHEVCCGPAPAPPPRVPSKPKGPTGPCRYHCGGPIGCAEVDPTGFCPYRLSTCCKRYDDIFDGRKSKKSPCPHTCRNVFRCATVDASYSCGSGLDVCCTSEKPHLLTGPQVQPPQKDQESSEDPVLPELPDIEQAAIQSGSCPYKCLPRLACDKVADGDHTCGFYGALVCCQTSKIAGSGPSETATNLCK